MEILGKYAEGMQTAKEVYIEAIENRKDNFIKYQMQYNNKLSNYAEGYIEALKDIIEIIK